MFRPNSINPYRLSYKLRDATLFESASKSTILFWRPFWNSNTSWMRAKYRLFSARYVALMENWTPILRISVFLELTSWISSLFYRDHLKIFHFFALTPWKSTFCPEILTYFPWNSKYFYSISLEFSLNSYWFFSCKNLIYALQRISVFDTLFV